MDVNELVALFEPYDGVNWRALPDGTFVVYVPFCDHVPIVVGTQELAAEVAAAIGAAFGAGVDAGQEEG